MDDTNTWSRRRFTKAVVSLHMLIATGALQITGCSVSETQDGLVSSHLDLLKLLMDELIPGNGSMPAASDAGVMEYITGLMKEDEQLMGGFTSMLSAVEKYTTERKNATFDELSPDQRTALLTGFESDQPDLFRVLLNFVYEGYYTNKDIWRRIGYEPYPTIGPSPAMEPFDENLLNQVRKMDILYKKT